MKMSFQMSKYKIEKGRPSETRSVGFAHGRVWITQKAA